MSTTMATENIDAGAPNLNLTQEEKRVYGLLFRQADSNNLGVVTGEVAVKFFEKTGLNSRVLGEIWQIADKENRGFLTPAGFGIVLRLIGHAQASREPTAELALNPGPLPRFEGVNIPPPPPLQSRPPPAVTPSAGLVPTPTGLPTIPAQGPGGASIQIPALTPEKVTQYATLFERQPLQSGNMLPGDAAKSIFEKSGLPNEVLGRIWQLADTEQRGALVMTEFVMSMHLLTCMKSGALRALPTILPAPLYEAATQRAPARGSPVTTTPPVPPIPKQLSGTAQHQAQMRTGSPLARQPLAPPPPVTSHASGMSRVTPQGTGMAGGDWLITPADKVRFDQIYDTMDTTRRGFITGEEAVAFFGQSNLSEDILAQIWDLADINSKGQLTRDEFAVAMYLIRQQRMRRDGANTLPTVLPPNLIPPSMRAARAAPSAVASAFDAPAIPQPAPPPPQPRSALDDLFGLTSSPTPAAPVPAQVQTSMATGGSNASRDPFSSGSPPAPGSPAAPLSSQGTGYGASNFKPFMPSSSFGLSLAPNKTGESTGSAPAQLQVPASIEEDLLGDTDPEISKKLTNETAELANMSSQIGTLGKQMHDLQNKRNSTQQELTQASAQKKQLESKLAHLRTMYENEAREVRSLEQQLSAARVDTKKIQTEYAMLEASVTDLRNNKHQVLTGLQADQQENASLKEKIRAVNAEITALKPQIEKLKSEARQHKGLVAINKKQLSTNESERDKLKAEADELTKSNEELSRQISAGSPVSTSAQVASPTLSTTSANNPFFRRTASTDVVGTFASPPVKSVSDSAFNDIFGPFPTSATSTPPPTSFKKPETSTSSPYATPGSASPQLSRQVPATSSSEPPAPPESKQITSSFLPIREPADSISSSRQVSPPASRMGFADATPTESSGPNPLSPNATGRSIGSGSGIASDGGREGPKPAATFPQESKPAATAENMFGGSTAEDALKQTNTASVAPADPFAAMDKTVAKDAFDDAFASFGTSKSEDKSAFDTAFASFGSKSSTEKQSEGSGGKSVDAFNAEFPPISELEREDDESDSESDKGGFEDDFAPTSPLNKGKEASGAAAVAASSATEETPKSDTSTVTNMPSTNAAPAPNSLTATSSGAPGMDNIFASPANNPPSVTATMAQHAPSGSIDKKLSTPFDELDDEFEGLEDAKEGSADDEYANISRSGLDDFNPVFDSSPPPSQAKSESTAFGAESSFDFANVSEGSSGHLAGGRGAGASHAQSQAIAAAAPAAATSTSAADAIAKAPLSPDNQDWEALFAGLDSPPGSAGTATAATTSKPAEGAADTAGAVTTAATPTPTTTTAPAGAEKLPVVGRALTEEGLHDDPTLTQLVAMGYEREEALAALEKCNYDAERVSSSSSSSNSPPVAQQQFLDRVLGVLRKQKVEKEKVQQQQQQQQQQQLKQEDRTEKVREGEKEKEKEGEEGWWS